MVPGAGYACYARFENFRDNDSWKEDARLPKLSVPASGPENQHGRAFALPAPIPRDRDFTSDIAPVLFVSRYSLAPRPWSPSIALQTS